MGETLNWSHGSLYKEEVTILPRVSFRYPSRLESAGLLVMTAVGGIGLLSWYFLERSNGLLLGVSGAFTLFMAMMAVLRIWDQRLVTIDRATREIHFLRRNPLRRQHDVVQASHLREVRVADHGDPDTTDSERKYWLFLVRMDGDRILLGGGTWEETVNLGRRFSELLRLSLELPSPPDRAH